MAYADDRVILTTEKYEKFKPQYLLSKYGARNSLCINLVPFLKKESRPKSIQFSQHPIIPC